MKTNPIQFSKSVKSPLRLRTQNSNSKSHRILAQNKKQTLLTQYNEKEPKFRLENHDYFCQETDHKQSLKFNDDNIQLICPTTSQQLSKNPSKQQFSHPQKEELAIVSNLTQKILYLESNFLRIQSNYVRKVSELTIRLKAKTQQNEFLNQTLSELLKEQKSTKAEVEMLAKQLLDTQEVRKDIRKNVEQNQHCISEYKIEVLPLNSTNQQNFCEKGRPKTSRLKPSQILFKKAKEKAEGKSSRIIKSQELRGNIRGQQRLTGTMAFGRSGDRSQIFRD